MRQFKGIVRGGQVVVQERVDYPDGTELDIDVHEPVVELDETQRAALVEAIDEGRAQVAAGRVRPAKDLIRELRARG